MAGVKSLKFGLITGSVILLILLVHFLLTANISKASILTQRKLRSIISFLIEPQDRILANYRLQDVEYRVVLNPNLRPIHFAGQISFVDNLNMVI